MRERADNQKKRKSRPQTRAQQLRGAFGQFTSERVIQERAAARAKIKEAELLAQGRVLPDFPPFPPPRTWLQRCKDFFRGKL